MLIHSALQELLSFSHKHYLNLVMLFHDLNLIMSFAHRQDLNLCFYMCLSLQIKEKIEMKRCNILLLIPLNTLLISHI